MLTKEEVKSHLHMAVACGCALCRDSEKVARQLLAAMRVIEYLQRTSRPITKGLAELLKCYNDLCTPTPSSGTDSTEKASDAKSSPDQSSAGE